MANFPHLPTPLSLQNDFSADPLIIHQFRQIVKNIICKIDSRLLVIVGPCSIHDTTAALEYAHLLRKAAAQFADHLFLVMRVYFEKPRTTTGWRGFILDPFLDGTGDIITGLKKARKLLLDLTELKVPAATEFLDPILSNYFSDLITWGGIGARTSQSQIHRELASSLPFPIGFKNSTDGNIQVAIDAVYTARHPHYFLSINSESCLQMIPTQGNPHTHVILRGSDTAPNYAPHHIHAVEDQLLQQGLLPYLMIDCSHGNSMKRYQHQAAVINALTTQIINGHSAIGGVMLESNLVSGKQPLKNIERLQYGQSITDACLSWEETLPLLNKLAIACSRRNSIKVLG